MGITFKRGDGSAHSFTAKAAETRRLTPCGVNLAEELNNMYKTEHTLHVLHCDTALMDFYKCLGNWNGGAHSLGVYVTLYVKSTDGATMRLGIYERMWNVWHVKPTFHSSKIWNNTKAWNPATPGVFWEYKDEDSVGWVSKLAKRCGGPCAHTSQVDSVNLRDRALASGC